MIQPTLDEVALGVLQLEPEDREELARARDQLAALAFGNRVPATAQPLVAGAVRALTAIADGTSADPPAALGEVGRLLQSAVDAASRPVASDAARAERAA